MITLDASVAIALLDADAHHQTVAAFVREVTGEELVIHPTNLAEVLVGGARAGRARELLTDLEMLGLHVAVRRDDEPLQLAELRTDGAETPRLLRTAHRLDHGLHPGNRR